MWEWMFNKINGKHMRWQTHSLSLVGRVQVVQKVLSSHHIFFASAWLFTKTRFGMLEKILKDFLWSDGLGSKKRHCVKWDWYYLPKQLGGLGIKDIKTQGIALVAKWILQRILGK